MRDRGLLTELVYGTLQNKLALDYMLKPFIKKPEKVKDWVIHLLRMSLYQMEYLEKVHSLTSHSGWLVSTARRSIGSAISAKEGAFLCGYCRSD